jgi:hypothetical protein
VGVEVVRGLYAIGGLRENQVGLGRSPIAFACGQVHPGLTSWVILSRPFGTDRDKERVVPSQTLKSL